MAEQKLLLGNVRGAQGPAGPNTVSAGTTTSGFENGHFLFDDNGKVGAKAVSAESLGAMKSNALYIASDQTAGDAFLPGDGSARTLKSYSVTETGVYLMVGHMVIEKTKESGAASVSINVDSEEYGLVYDEHPFSPHAHVACNMCYAKRLEKGNTVYLLARNTSGEDMSGVKHYLQVVKIGT